MVILEKWNICLQWFIIVVLTSSPPANENTEWKLHEKQFINASFSTNFPKVLSFSLIYLLSEKGMKSFVLWKELNHAPNELELWISKCDYSITYLKLKNV